jgi:cytochrome c oxidase subunit 2
VRVGYYEKVFLVLGVIVLIAGLIAIAISIIGGIHVPRPEGRVDPTELRTTPPFDDPGVRELAPGQYEAVIIARTWAFETGAPEPGLVEVPAGSEVTFYISSPDVIHGFLIENTNINAMIIPGEITKVEATFEEPGEYLIVCHEYCGINHHTMSGRVVVK